MAHLVFDVALLCGDVIDEERQRLALQALLPKKGRALAGRVTRSRPHMALAGPGVTRH
jgi:hypothetical protein